MVEVLWMKVRMKITWKKQVEEEERNGCFEKEDALCRSKGRVGVDQIAVWLR